jgi:hypothetical protein
LCEEVAAGLIGGGGGAALDKLSSEVSADSAGSAGDQPPLPGPSLSPNATVGSLQDLIPGNVIDPQKFDSMFGYSDEQLLDAVNNPTDGSYLQLLRAGSNILVQGNTRAALLALRSISPDSGITLDTPIYIKSFGAKGQ